MAAVLLTVLTDIREITVDVPGVTADELSSQIQKAMNSSGSVLAIHDSDGSQVLVPVRHVRSVRIGLPAGSS